MIHTQYEPRAKIIPAIVATKPFIPRNSITAINKRDWGLEFEELNPERKQEQLKKGN